MRILFIKTNLIFKKDVVVIFIFNYKFDALRKDNITKIIVLSFIFLLFIK